MTPMSTAPSAQSLRRDAIVRILRSSAVARQAELVDLLAREGFEATPSSVSRDLRAGEVAEAPRWRGRRARRELGVVKGADRYLLPAVEDALTPSHFEAVRAF